MLDKEPMSIGAKLVITGSFECIDKDGNVLKTIHGTGSFPLENLGLTVEQAHEIIAKEKGNGLDNR